MILMSTEDIVPILPIYKITVMLQTISSTAILYLLFLWRPLSTSVCL